MVTADTGVDVSVSNRGAAFAEMPGRAVIQTTDPEAVRDAFDGLAPVHDLGAPDESGCLRLTTGDDSFETDAEQIADWRSVISQTLD
ncbi:MAG: hypothetical protein A07HR60_02624 [uncultured archaeon A07HR60]|nr:MAG: hypothetical protein A07HR60_02624 [uncultured archaeon A07HR60]